MNDALTDSEEYKALQQQIDELNKVLEPYGIKAPDIAKTMQSIQESINKSAEAIQNVEISLKKLGTSGDAINSALSEMSEKSHKSTRVLHSLITQFRDLTINRFRLIPLLHSFHNSSQV